MKKIAEGVARRGYISTYYKMTYSQNKIIMHEIFAMITKEDRVAIAMRPKQIKQAHPTWSVRFGMRTVILRWFSLKHPVYHRDYFGKMFFFYYWTKIFSLSIWIKSLISHARLYLQLYYVYMVEKQRVGGGGWIGRKILLCCSNLILNMFVLSLKWWRPRFHYKSQNIYFFDNDFHLLILTHTFIAEHTEIYSSQHNTLLVGLWNQYVLRCAI